MTFDQALDIIAQPKPQIGRPAAATEPHRRLSDAEREGCVMAPVRHPCIRCGTRYDLHDDHGCRRWRG